MAHLAVLLPFSSHRSLGTRFNSQHRSVLAFVALVVGAVFAPGFAVAGQKGPPERVTKLVDTAAKTVWKIEQPNINQPETHYRQIVFKPGDRVTMSAGGCARRGGNPPPNGPAVPYLHGDNLYMGTIFVPGIVPGGVKQKIEAFVGTHDIAANTNLPNMYLTLGYEDNDFSDNNYNDIDDIDSGPCKGLGYAWVRIEIDHGEVTTDAGGESPHGEKPMDMVWDALDDNGLPLNPKWQFESDRPGSHPDPVSLCDLRTPNMPRCTSQYVTDDSTPNVAANAGCNLPTANAGEQFAGHKNWWGATFTGSVALGAGYSRYTGASLLVGWDADLDFAMVPTSGSALTESNINHKGGAFSMEFDGEEVLFDRSHSSFWWSHLYDVENDDRAKEMFNPGGPSVSPYVLPAGKPYDDSVVLGLVGLDCRHDCFTELHPVYALAAHLETTPDDRWAVFARNWGDEGSCGAQDHQLDLTTITLRIPHKGATAVRILSQTEVRANGPSTGWNLSTTIHNPGTDQAYALITFNLPLPVQKAVVAGDLMLAWTDGSPGPERLAAHPAMIPAPERLAAYLDIIRGPEHLATHPAKTEEEARPRRADPAIDAALNRLPSAQQKAFRANLPATPHSIVTLNPDTTVVPLPRRHKHPWETHKVASNQARIDELSKANRELCSFLGGKVEGLPDTCKNTSGR